MHELLSTKAALLGSTAPDVDRAGHTNEPSMTSIGGMDGKWTTFFCSATAHTNRASNPSNLPPSRPPISFHCLVLRAQRFAAGRREIAILLLAIFDSGPFPVLLLSSRHSSFHLRWLTYSLNITFLYITHLIGRWYTCLFPSPAAQ